MHRNYISVEYDLDTHQVKGNCRSTYVEVFNLSVINTTEPIGTTLGRYEVH